MTKDNDDKSDSHDDNVIKDKQVKAGRLKGINKRPRRLILEKDNTRPKEIEDNSWLNSEKKKKDDNFLL